jgi:hypothetical protein
MPRPLVLLVALLALALGACGGNDEKEVEQTVKKFIAATNARDAESFCDDLVTQDFIERSTGAKGEKAREACKEQFKALKGLKVKLVRVSETKVNGDKASAKAELEVQGQKQDQLYRLSKEDGEWKLAGG